MLPSKIAQGAQFLSSFVSLFEQNRKLRVAHHSLNSQSRLAFYLTFLTLSLRPMN